MALSRYDLLVGATAADLQDKVRARQATGNVVVYNMFQRGGYYCQGVGTGSLDIGTVTQYRIVSSANVDTFATLVSSMLPTLQPIGTPVVYNSALFQVMGMVQAYNMSGQNGTDGKTPQIRVADGYIQWKYTTDITWNNLVAMGTLTGANPEMRVTAGSVQWKLTTDDDWQVLFGLEQLTGSAGPQGPQGDAGTQGLKGESGPANSLSVGTVLTGTAGSNAAVTISGSAPAQTLNLTIPRGDTGSTGPANSLTIGTVTTGSAGSNAAVTLSGSAPNQTLNLTIPRGNTGAGAVSETISGTVATAGVAVAVTFAKTYSAVPNVTPVITGDTNTIVLPLIGTVTQTGCSVTVVRTRGTLLLTTGPVEAAPNGTAFRLVVVGN